MKVKIKEVAREKKGWSLYKLASILNLPQQTIYSWANKRTQPSFESMDMLCTVLGCTLDDIFEIEPKTEYSPKQALLRQKQSIVKRYAHYKQLAETMGELP